MTVPHGNPVGQPKLLEIWDRYCEYSHNTCVTGGLNRFDPSYPGNPGRIPVKKIRSGRFYCRCWVKTCLKNPSMKKNQQKLFAQCLLVDFLGCLCVVDFFGLLMKFWVDFDSFSIFSRNCDITGLIQLAAFFSKTSKSI